MSSRRVLFGLLGVLLLGAFAFLSGCGGDNNDNTVTPPPPPPPTTGSIVGTASLPPGLPGDLGNARVGLFSSIDNWNADVPVRPFGRVVGSGPSVQINETNLPGGMVVIVEVWSDANRDGVFNFGDWWAITGTSTWPNPTPSFVTVVAGQVTPVTLYLISIQQ